MKDFMIFMSWDNDYKGETVRAVALCKRDGYFSEAINCMRDGSMGEERDGVYERHWYSDYIQKEDCKNLRPATREEVKLYTQHINIHDAIGDYPEFPYRVRPLETILGEFFSLVIVEVKVKWWKKIKSFFKKKYPF